MGVLNLEIGLTCQTNSVDIEVPHQYHMRQAGIDKTTGPSFKRYVLKIYQCESSFLSFLIF